MFKLSRWTFPVVGFTTLALSIVTPLISSAPAYAATTDFTTECVNTNLPDWDWPGYMRQPDNGTTKNGGNQSNFNPSTDSYLIWSAEYNGGTVDAASNNVFDMYYPTTSGAKIVLSVETISSHPWVTVRSTTGTMTHITIQSTPKTNPSFATLYSGLSSRGTDLSPAPPDWEFLHNASGSTVSQPFQVARTDTLPSGVPICAYAGRNIQYDPSFTALFNTLNTSVAYTATTGTTCSGLDVGCWIGKAVDGVDNTLITLFTSAVHVIGNLFVPDPVQLANSYDGLSTFLNSHLGFLTYPFTFIGDVYDAFTTSTSGCDSSSCSLDVGNIYGHDYTINFLAPKEISTSLFDYILLTIQGITVVILIIAIHKKYMEVVKQ